jgi:hypothetical protein
MAVDPMTCTRTFTAYRHTEVAMKLISPQQNSPIMLLLPPPLQAAIKAEAWSPSYWRSTVEVGKELGHRVN